MNPTADKETRETSGFFNPQEVKNQTFAFIMGHRPSLCTTPVHSCVFSPWWVQPSLPWWDLLPLFLGLSCLPPGAGFHWGLHSHQSSLFPLKTQNFCFAQEKSKQLSVIAHYLRHFCLPHSVIKHSDLTILSILIHTSGAIFKFALKVTFQG